MKIGSSIMAFFLLLAVSWVMLGFLLSNQGNLSEKLEVAENNMQALRNRNNNLQQQLNITQQQLEESANNANELNAELQEKDQRVVELEQAFLQEELAKEQAYKEIEELQQLVELSQAAHMQTLPVNDPKPVAIQDQAVGAKNKNNMIIGLDIFESGNFVLGICLVIVSMTGSGLIVFKKEKLLKWLGLKKSVDIPHIQDVVWIAMTREEAIEYSRERRRK